MVICSYHGVIQALCMRTCYWRRPLHVADCTRIQVQCVHLADQDSEMVAHTICYAGRLLAIRHAACCRIRWSSCDMMDTQLASSASLPLQHVLP